ncbi:MAG: D-aminoacyl-tRNA deacylase [Gammaproteobacteria bacterium]|nr:D-aminoacyl-tRNA deacylase [Gammaproteobacteria bacterium]
MIALLQRVREARVEINHSIVGQIGQGLLVFVGFEPSDNKVTVKRQLDRLLAYRIFADQDEKMNLSLLDIEGGLLLVPQFTLTADTTRGRRPSFTSAAAPQLGQELFDYLCDQARNDYQEVATGTFGADMQVHLQNDGPVTFILN